MLQAWTCVTIGKCGPCSTHAAGTLILYTKTAGATADARGACPTTQATHCLYHIHV